MLYCVELHYVQIMYQLQHENKWSELKVKLFDVKWTVKWITMHLQTDLTCEITCEGEKVVISKEAEMLYYELMRALEEDETVGDVNWVYHRLP